MNWLLARLGCSCLVLLFASVAAAQSAQQGGDALALGVKVTFTSGKQTDVMSARLIALSVPEITPPTSFLPPGPFTATFEGFISLRIRGEYIFRPVGSGSVKVFVNDKPAPVTMGGEVAMAKGEPVKLTKGKNKIRVEYASPQKGDAIFRLYWAERGPAEPVPPTVLMHDAKDEALAKQSQVRDGRNVFGALRCIRCHGSSSLKLETAMPELSQDAPDLSKVGLRLKRPWMAAWIANPRKFNPRAEMPRMLASASPDAIPQEAADIASYLAQVDGAAPSVPTPAAANEAQMVEGARLYGNLGCLACHTPPDFGGTDAVTPARIPHKHIRAKYNLPALVEFLKKPEAHFQWIRMPNFHLSDEEAAALGQYLYYTCSEESAQAPAGDPVRGKQLFMSSGCLNCHTAEGMQNSSKTPALADLKKQNLGGCLAKDTSHRGQAPDFGLDAGDRAALAAFLAGDAASLAQDAAPEFAERQIAQLNCAACHPRDKQDDVWSTIGKDVGAFLAKLPPEPAAGEQYAPDQSRPPLTWVGEKLRPEWMAGFIGGKIAYKPRPWIRARMPWFPIRAKRLAAGLALEHGFAPASPQPAQQDQALAETGQKLVGKTGGFSCVQCHAVGQQKALAAFEAPAPNFAHVTERLRPDYFYRWMSKPQRVQPGTRMPDFADAEGKTALKNYFEGDADKQFMAIWNYLLAGEKIVPPAQ
ncbi:MAG TPA: c-type cytochrome [Tepidisphaeraceae bacterium]|jgi:mono/diheme cytochrome c family protein